MNERWPIRCPVRLRQEQLKIEPIQERIKRLAENIWQKIEDENTEFHQLNTQTRMQNPHTWFPSSYLKTFE